MRHSSFITSYTATMYKHWDTAKQIYYISRNIAQILTKQRSPTADSSHTHVSCYIPRLQASHSSHATPTLPTGLRNCVTKPQSAGQPTYIEHKNEYTVQHTFPSLTFALSRLLQRLPTRENVGLLDKGSVVLVSATNYVKY
jgi:hypothetical protein